MTDVLLVGGPRDGEHEPWPFGDDGITPAPDIVVHDTVTWADLGGPPKKPPVPVAATDPVVIVLGHYFVNDDLTRATFKASPPPRP